MSDVQHTLDAILEQIQEVAKLSEELCLHVARLWDTYDSLEGEIFLADANRIMIDKAADKLNS